MKVIFTTVPNYTITTYELLESSSPSTDSFLISLRKTCHGLAIGRKRWYHKNSHHSHGFFQTVKKKVLILLLATSQRENSLTYIFQNMNEYLHWDKQTEFWFAGFSTTISQVHLSVVHLLSNNWNWLDFFFKW